MIKLFVSDMDGTLLNSKAVISDRNAQSIKRLQAAGIEFMIATGRTFHSAHPFLEMQGIECEMINLNGAAVYDNHGRLEKSIPIGMDQAKTIISYCKEKQLSFSIMDAENFYVNNQQEFLSRVFRHLHQEDQTQDSRLQFAAEVGHVKDLQDYVMDAGHPILKISILSSDNPQALDNFYQDFKDTRHLDITSSGKDNLEITHAHAQKGLAVQDYVQAKGWSMKEVLAIGDSLNDRSMLTMAKYGYVMDNASDEVKALSPLRAPHHDRDGVAQIIDKLLNAIETGKDFIL